LQARKNLLYAHEFTSAFVQPLHPGFFPELFPQEQGTGLTRKIGAQ
jgi:hypothetical protein